MTQDEVQVAGGAASEGFNRRQALQKLAVGGVIVWSAPVISGMTTAAAAASGCVPQVLDWETFTQGSVFSSTTLGGVTVSITTSFSGTSAMARNLTVQPTPHGGITGQSLMFEQYPFANSVGQTVTISFSQPVQNVSFTITDIDNQASAWSDRVTLVTTPSSNTLGSAVIGIGAFGSGTGGNTDDGNGGNNTGTGAFRNSNSDNNLNDNSSAGNLTLTYAGPLPEVSFRYWCGGVGAGTGSNQRINLSNISFDPCL